MNHLRYNLFNLFLEILDACSCCRYYGVAVVFRVIPVNKSSDLKKIKKFLLVVAAVVDYSIWNYFVII